LADCALDDEGDTAVIATNDVDIAAEAWRKLRRSIWFIEVPQQEGRGSVAKE
jgi:hypothetical protein